MKKIYLLFFFLCFFNLSAQNGTYYLSNFLISPHNFTSLNQVVTYLNSQPAPSTLIMNANIGVTSNVTITEKIALKFQNGFKVSIPNGVILTLNCSIDAGIFQIFDTSVSGKTNGYPLIEQTYPEWWHKPNDFYWTDAIQSAVDFYPKVFFSSKSAPYEISKSITLDLSKNDQAGYILTGVGRSSAFSNYTSQTTDFVFKCINIPAVGYLGGLKFENLNFYCYNAIAIESPGGFGTMDESSPIQNVKINNCRFYQQISNGNPSVVSNNNVAISFKKVFDSEISNNYIIGFGTGIKFQGSDINTIRDNRVMNFYHYAICDLAFGTFGSQNTIVHNDLLGYKGDQNKGAFIKSTSRHIIIRDNYLENQPSTQNPQHPNSRIYAYIDCSKRNLAPNTEYYLGEFTKIIDITGNRSDVENNTCTNYIYFIDEKFKFLNLVESPNISAYTLGSTFCTYETSNPVSHILLQMDNINRWDKIINIQSESFKGWENFSSSRYFADASNGDLLISPKNFSHTIVHGQYEMQRFNSRGLMLQKDQAIFVQINQKDSTNLSFGSLPKNLNFKIKVRNYRKTAQDPLDTNNNDLYFSIKTSTVEMPLPLYWTNIEIPDGDNFSTLSVTIPYPFSNAASNQVPADYFDPSKVYYISIAARNSTKEIREMILEAVPPVSSAKQKEKEEEGKDLKSDETEEETVEEIQRIIVNNEIKTYPNPVKDKITFDIKEGDSLKAVELYDTNGKFIQNLTNKITENSVDISTLESGTYFVKIISLSTTSKTIIKK